MTAAPPTKQVARRDAPAVGMAPDVEKLWGTCVALSRSEMLPSPLTGHPGNLFFIGLLGQQFGMPLPQAVLNIHPIPGGRGGKTSFAMAANLWVSLARRAGHKVRKGEHTATSCTVYLWRKGEFDEDPHEATFTIADADTAGLLGNDNYRKNPKAMLYARAASTVVREGAGEVVLGFVDEYEAEVLGDDAVPQPPVVADLAAAVAEREARDAPPPGPAEVADDGVVDAVVVEDPPPVTAEALADLTKPAEPEGDDPADADPWPCCGTVTEAHTDTCPLQEFRPEEPPQKRGGRREWSPEDPPADTTTRKAGNRRG